MMNLEEITLTPELAKEFLQGNTANRPLNEAHVHELAREMEAGRWKMNGDTICRNGTKLIDGQHRCHAVIKSGLSIPAILVSGLKDDVFDTKDCGKRRGAAGVLAIRGEKNYASLAATLQFVDRYMQGKLNSHRTRYSNSVIESLLAKYPDSRASVKYCAAIGTKRLVPTSIMAGLHFLMASSDREAADEFWESLIRGSNLDENSPIFVLRERLVANTVAKARLRPVYISALIIKAWNAWRSGSTVKALRWIEDGRGKQDFPLLKR